MTSRTENAMNFPSLISVAELARQLAGPQSDILVCDCRFELAKPQAGRQSYEHGHIPGAHYMDLNTDLSDLGAPDQGRHPLPDREAFARTMRDIGANDSTLIVAYDAGDGMFAARLWWLLRWIGHGKVQVLDGGLQAWQAAGHGTSASPPPARPQGRLQVKPPLTAIVSHEQVLESIDSKSHLVIDARSPDRYRGENETIDPVGGHIPGAHNRHFKDNLTADGLFKEPKQLVAEFSALMQGRAANEIVSQCGSGVTACHNLLAMEVAGLAGAALYPGSWSQWCRKPGMPVATGTD